MKSTIEAALAVLLLAGPAMAGPVELSVTATAETEATAGDADDPAIWVDPAAPERARILGTDKQVGLRVYDLTGRLVQDFPDGHLNNVDLRPFTLAGRAVWLVGASRRDDDTMAFYVMEGDGTLSRADPFTLPAAPADMAGAVDDVYGFAMQRDPATGRVFALVNFKSGHVLQWQISDEAGRLGATLVRHWQVATQPEGMVADDAGGFIYVGEEDAGIWRVPADPAAAPVAEAVDRIPSPCLPRDDVEGMAIHDRGRDRYLVASAQGIHRAAVYRLDAAGAHCVALVGVAAGAVDGVTETDGLDVTAAALPGYPQGLLVMMDDQNAGFSTNFKLIDWAAIAAGLPPR